MSCPSPPFADLLPAQPVSLSVLASRYLQPGESGVGHVLDRVAKALAQAELPGRRAHFQAVFRQHLSCGGLVAGRIMAGAGTGLPVTQANCFVLPVSDGAHAAHGPEGPGLAGVLQEATRTLRWGGGVGYDFSDVRPVAARHDGSEHAPCGPCGFVDALNRVGGALQATGVRRGAQMAVLRCDHPDVLDFISAKTTPGRWSNFNVSVGVSDAFMHAVEHGLPWALVHRVPPANLAQAQVSSGMSRQGDGFWLYRHLPARALWAAITQSAFDAAEPGVLFLDTLNRDNNLRAIETLSATNPCGEQPLPPYGSCVLGPLILPGFVRHPFGIGGQAMLDFSALARSVQLQVRMLDNVLDVTPWPLAAQTMEAQRKRRIGVGFTGLADALIMLGLRYDQPPGREMAARIAQTLRDQAYAASVALARERGAFSLCDADALLAQGTCASRLPPALQAAIRRHGLRNSHLLSVAPTGSVSLVFADNSSAGIEPVFDWRYSRQIRQPDGSLQRFDVENHAWRLFAAMGGDVQHLPSAFVNLSQIRAQDQLAMVAAVQPFVDGGISKTVQLPADAAYADFAGLYQQAWRAGLKGLTAYRPTRLRGAVLRPFSSPARPFSGA